MCSRISFLFLHKRQCFYYSYWIIILEICFSILVQTKLPYSFYLFTLNFIWKAEKTGSFPKCPQCLAPAWGRAGSQELNPGLLHGCHKPNYLDHNYCLSAGVRSQNKVMNPGTPIWDADILNSVLTDDQTLSLLIICRRVPLCGHTRYISTVFSWWTWVCIHIFANTNNTSVKDNLEHCHSIQKHLHL